MKKESVSAQEIAEKAAGELFHPFSHENKLSNTQIILSAITAAVAQAKEEDARRGFKTPPNAEWLEKAVASDNEFEISAGTDFVHKALELKDPGRYCSSCGYKIFDCKEKQILRDFARWLRAKPEIALWIKEPTHELNR